MIASVRGTVAALGPDGAVIEVGGVGLAVSATLGTLARLRVGEQARLATSLVVREDSLTLYGFADDDERATFELLQTANGVGPKLAQTMLATHPPRELRRAIAGGDLPALMKVPGIGRKGAERIVVELRDRIGPIDAASGGGADAGALITDAAGLTAVAPWRDQLAHALASLGFSGKEASEAIDALAQDMASGLAGGTADDLAAGAGNAGGEVPDIGTLLRAAIQLLGRTR